MKIGFMTGICRSVDEVIKNQNLSGQLLALHGVLYLGEEFEEFVILPKTGAFDGIGVGPIQCPEKSRVVRVDEPNLLSRFKGNVSSAIGGFRYKMDCIVIGSIQKEGDSGYGANITGLKFMLLEGWRDNSSWQDMSFVFFQDDPLLSLPWTSDIKLRGTPILKMSPMPGEK